MASTTPCPALSVGLSSVTSVSPVLAPDVVREPVGDTTCSKHCERLEALGWTTELAAQQYNTTDGCHFCWPLLAREILERDPEWTSNPIKVAYFNWRYIVEKLRLDPNSNVNVDELQDKLQRQHDSIVRQAATITQMQHQRARRWDAIQSWEDLPAEVRVRLHRQDDRSRRRG